jgi:hypothetical protein
MSDTPRTDEIVRECGGVTSAWARKLETELTAVRLELEKAKAVRNDKERRRSKAEAENRELKAQLTALQKAVGEVVGDLMDCLPVLQVHAMFRTEDELRKLIEKLESALTPAPPQAHSTDCAVNLNARHACSCGVEQVCNWACEDGTWEGSCGVMWEFTAGGPIENGVKFCVNCGLPVLVKGGGR